MQRLLMFPYASFRPADVRQELEPQNPTVPLTNLAANVENLLTGDCGEFVNRLFETVANKYGLQHDPHSKNFNLLDVFNLINRRPGGVLFQQAYDRGKPISGTVSGQIGHPKYPASIIISPIVVGTLSPVMVAYTNYAYAMTAIHETFHLAGTNGGYSDQELAQAVYDLEKAPGVIVESCV